MSRQKLLKIFLTVGCIFILLALLLWIEFSFVLAGVGVIIIGIGTLLYLNKK